MTKRHHDARRLDDVADRMIRDAKLVRRLADATQEAHRHIADELEFMGWPTKSEQVGGRGHSELTAVERDAERTWQLTSVREDVRDQARALVDGYNDYCAQIKAHGIITHTARRTGIPKRDREALNRQDGPGLCCDNQVGKHAADEWGDGLCHMPGVKSGLCERHYMAWYRARKRDGIDVSRDHGAVA